MSPARPTLARGRALQVALLLAAAALAPRAASAYSFRLASDPPTQCEDLVVDVAGAGAPPYTLTLLPLEDSTLIPVSAPFNTSTSVAFQLTYPANTHFVAVVSDSTGFGTGGVSAVLTVSPGDASCLPSGPPHPVWTWSSDPDTSMTSCSPQRIWWKPNMTVTEGSPRFQAVVPGGDAFEIPQGTLTNTTNEGLGFNWTVSVRPGTSVIIVGSDGRGYGSGGSTLFPGVQQGNLSCINEKSLSSTSGAPMSTNTSSVIQSGSSVPVGAIVGGAVGGIAAIALALFLLLLLRRRRSPLDEKQRRPVEIFPIEDDITGRDSPLPDGHEPRPFISPPSPNPFTTPDTTTAPTSIRECPSPSSYHGTILRGPSGSISSASTHLSQSPSARQPSFLSSHSRSTSDGGPPRGSAASATTCAHRSRASLPSLPPPAAVGPPRKGPAVLWQRGRRTTVIQHADAGPSPSQSEPEELEPEPETVELPPAYTTIGQNAAAPAGPSRLPPPPWSATSEAEGESSHARGAPMSVLAVSNVDEPPSSP